MRAAFILTVSSSLYSNTTRGHTQMEVDYVHAQIERVVKIRIFTRHPPMLH